MGTRRPWTSAELDYLVEKYDKRTAAEIAEHLHRSTQAIYRQGWNLCLSRDRVPRKYGRLYELRNSRWHRVG